MTAASGRPTVDGPLRGTQLSPSDRLTLLEAQGQCMLSFHDSAGWPRGVVLSYLYTLDRFWLTAIEGRPHVEGPRADPRVTVVVNNLGTSLPGRQMLAQRGMAQLHTDRRTLDWFYPLFAAKHEPQAPEQYVQHLDTPTRVVIEVTPIGTGTSHDSRRLAGDGRGGLQTHE